MVEVGAATDDDGVGAVVRSGTDVVFAMLCGVADELAELSIDDCAAETSSLHAEATTSRTPVNIVATVDRRRRKHRRGVTSCRP